MNRLTRKQAAAYLGCSESTFSAMLAKGYLKDCYYTLMSRKFYITEKLDDFIKKGGCEQWQDR